MVDTLTVIVSADKGKATVILYINYYQKKLDCLLCDETVIVKVMWIKNVSFVGRHPDTCSCGLNTAFLVLWDQFGVFDLIFPSNLDW